MQDAHSRTIDYLRIAVTDRCNLRCRYCMPAEGIPLLERGEILHYGEISEIVEALLPLGIDKIRLTGGEPLVRKDLERLIERLSRLPLKDLALTTNGILLAEKAEALKAAGLRRLNISLDSLDPHCFQELTRGGMLSAVKTGIEKALEVGFEPIKVNAVVIPGVNEGELSSFARLTVEHPIHVRFIEFMPLGNHGLYEEKRFLPADEIQRRLEMEFPLQPASVSGNGPARVFRIEGAAGTIGLIDPMSHGFCRVCNRLRLTADGKLKPCLTHPLEFDLKGPLRAGADHRALQELAKQALAAKPAGSNYAGQPRSMSQIGG